jgi:beta-N-acetylhexosaminidase
MEAACIAGSYGERARQALQAGCDMVLVCNHTDGAAEVLHELEDYKNPTSQVRLMRMHGKYGVPMAELHTHTRWRQAHELIQGLDDSPWIEMEL